MKGIAKISVKILALYFLSKFITESVPQIIGIINSRQSVAIEIITAIVITEVLKLIIALYLWNSAEKLSKLMIGNVKEEPIKEINYRQLHLIAFSVVGIVLLAVSIPDLAQYILEYFVTLGSGIMLPKLAAKIIEIIIGIFLLVKSNIIVDRIVT